MRGAAGGGFGGGMNMDDIFSDSLQSNRYEDVRILDIILDFKKSIRKIDFNYGIMTKGCGFLIY